MPTHACLHFLCGKAGAGKSTLAKTLCKAHHAILRALAFKWLRILWRCWRDRVPYDPTKHRAAKQMLSAA